MNQLVLAQQLHQAGFFVIPIRLDGSKSPTVSWKFYSERALTDNDINRWFQEDCGHAIVGGPCSGNAEFIDFEATDSYEKWSYEVQNANPLLHSRLVIVKTPGSKFFDSDGTPIPGRHVYYRVEGDAVPGSMDLAKNKDGKAFIETRGNGAYVVLPGHSRVHPSGKPYEFLQGNFASIPTISWEERDLLISTAESFNEYVEQGQIYEPKRVNDEVLTDRPGDIFNAQGDWSFLCDYGWKLVSQQGSYCKWKRPGKKIERY